MSTRTKIDVDETIDDQNADDRFDELYRQLNDQQKAAVDSIEGPVMVLAGPGTGKTQVLAMRVANILRQTQMDPWNILCLTFTETATVEMRQRLISIIGRAAYYVKVYTFHAFCNEVIQENPDKFLFGKTGQVLSDIEKAELWRGLIDKLPSDSPIRPFGRPYMFLSEVVRAVQLLKKEGLDVGQLTELIDGTEDFVKKTSDVISSFAQLPVGDRTEGVCSEFMQNLEKGANLTKTNDALWLPFKDAWSDYQDAILSADNQREAGKARTQFKNKVKRYWQEMEKQVPKQRDLARLYGLYQEELSKSGRYDFEDMILQVVKKFRENDELLARYQEQFQYVLIDEYQDTNGAQNETVRLLGSFNDRPNIFVVGDDKQSIFRFQGASLDNLLSFYRAYLDSIRIVSLQKNYRSEQQLIDAASAVINHNQETVQKYIKQVVSDLVAHNRKGSAVLEHKEYKTEEEECFGVSKRVKSLIDQGVSPGDIAVLFRANKEASGLAGALDALGIYYRLEAGENALADRRVRQLIVMLEYISGSLGEVARGKLDEDLAKILHYNFLGLAPIDVAMVIYFAGRQKTGLYEVIVSADRLAAAEVDDVESFLALGKKLAEWRVFAGNHTLPQIFDIVLRESGMLRQIVNESDGVASLNNINAVFKEVKQLSGTQKDVTIREFARRLIVMGEDGLRIKSDVLSVEDKAVRLMTAHRAKGLEFGHVFIPGLVDRHWGSNPRRGAIKLPRGIVHFDPVSEGENNEDERRLFYVALTRAKSGLYLSHARLSDSGRERVPSLFLLEIPDGKIKKSLAKNTQIDDRARLVEVSAGRSLAQKHNPLKDWLRGRLKNYTMSVTHLNNYLECPLLFYYRNLLRAPAAKNKHMALGTAVHSALRDMFDKINRQGDVPTERFLLDAYQTYLKRESLAKKEMEESLTYGRQILGDYYKRYGDEFGKAKSLVEFSFKGHGVRVTDGQLSLPLTGQLDKIELIGRDRVNVVDYKTGNPDSAASHVRPGGKYYRQLVFYKLLCDESPRFERKMISGEIDFVQKSKRKNKHVKFKHEIGEREVIELKEEIARVWSEILELSFLDHEDGNCGECEYCTQY